MSTGLATSLLRFSLLGLLLLAGCATATPKLASMAVSSGEAAMENAFQRTLVLEQQFVDEHRLQTIRFNIGRGAARLCAGYGLGVFSANRITPWIRSSSARALAYSTRTRFSLEMASA